MNPKKHILKKIMQKTMYCFITLTSIEHSYIPGTMLDTCVEQCLPGTYSAVGEARNIQTAYKVPGRNKGAKKL